MQAAMVCAVIGLMLFCFLRGVTFQQENIYAKRNRLAKRRAQLKASAPSGFIARMFYRLCYRAGQAFSSLAR